MSNKFHILKIIRKICHCCCPGFLQKKCVNLMLLIHLLQVSLPANLMSEVPAPQTGAKRALH